jgi:hypothetical protein
VNKTRISINTNYRSEAKRNSGSGKLQKLTWKDIRVLSKMI